MLGLFGLVLLSAAGSTRILCSPDSRLARLDEPNERSLHGTPMPRTGGLAIFGSVLLGIVVGLALGEGAALRTDPALWILGMTLLVGAVSFWDDRAGLSQGVRLGVHALAAAGIVWGAGVRLEAVAVPLMGSVPLGWIAAPVTILLLMWMANLYNFMDGMDGFAGGMTLLGYGFLAYFAWRGGHQFIFLVALLVAGAAAGFLWFNLPPARIFMGDVGSVPLGFLAAALAVLGVRDGVFDVWVPLLIFSPFVVDATVTLARRLLRGEKIWLAHREHYYQRLVLAGWGHRKTALAEYLLMVVCGLAAVAYGMAGAEGRLAILAGCMAGYTVLAVGVGRISAPPASDTALPNLDSIIRGLLYVYIFCLPFSRFLFVERNGFIILCVLLALWCAVNQRHFFTRTPIDLPLLAFVGWVAVTLPFSASPAYSIKEFAKLLQQGLLFYLVVFFFRDDRHRRRLVWMLVAGLLLVSVRGIGQFTELIGRTLQEGEIMLVESVTPGEVWLTTYLVLMLPLSLALALCLRHPSARAAGFIITGLATLCLMLTYSRAGLLAFLCEAALLAVLVRRRAVVIGVSTAALVVIVGSAALYQANLTAAMSHKAAGSSSSALPGTGTLMHRLEAWKFAMGEISEHWLVGVGYGKDKQKEIYGGLPAAREEAGPARYPGTHNTFLDIALGVGVPGMLLFVWLLQRVFAVSAGGFRRAADPMAAAVSLGVAVAVAGLSVRLLFDHMLIGTLALQFWVLVALATMMYTTAHPEER